MNKEEIIQKARRYLEQETDRTFSEQVWELLQREDYEELSDRFYVDLDFGTGGLRGVIGGGYNRINPYIIRRATQGLANYLLRTVTEKEPSMVIAHDSRNYSAQFARDAALVLCGNGIKTFLFDGLRPTPQLSFSVRHLGAGAGIVITASHNPAKYNGYKVYWSDGGQIVPPHDRGIITEVKAVGDDIRGLSYDTARDKGLLVIPGPELDDAYIRTIKEQALRPQLLRESGSRLSVVYTPLHGSGAVPVERALRELGITITFVEEQQEPDGDFPTVEFPNPEIAPAMRMSLELASKVGADLVMGTDPDADRLGIAVPDNGQYVLVTGNQLGALLADYIFSTRHELGTLPRKCAFIKTIVTTELQTLIARRYGAACFDTLTGFKYIAEKIREFETQADGVEYIFGGEESYGYLTGTAVRDKDAVSAAAMTAEMTLYHVSRGHSLLDHLNELYKTYGYFEETLVSTYFEGEKGLIIMRELMARLRKDPPRTLGGVPVTSVRDYLDATVLDIASGSKRRVLQLPSSNVLQFICGDDSIVTARPSGTEPKIKFYASCRGRAGEDLDEAKRAVGKRIGAIRDELQSLTII